MYTANTPDAPDYTWRTVCGYMDGHTHTGESTFLTASNNKYTYTKLTIKCSNHETRISPHVSDFNPARRFIPHGTSHIYTHIPIETHTQRSINTESYLALYNAHKLDSSC